MAWIAALPASQEAERLLALPGIGPTCRDPMLPALLALLQWALEDVPGLDKSRALGSWEALMQLDLRGEPGAAVAALLPCADPEREVPPELLGNSADEAAAGIVALAASAAWRSPRSGRRLLSGLDLFTPVRQCGDMSRVGPAARQGDARSAEIAVNQAIGGLSKVSAR